ncbi:MAG: multicopper oxidase domain-containing protein [Rhizomicrobium sp.]|jgi:FtsP/CotA-like multicopper oxidase with cupredoxin domain
MEEKIDLELASEDVRPDEHPTDVSRRNLLVGTAAVAVAASGLTASAAPAKAVKHPMGKAAAAKVQDDMFGMEAGPPEVFHAANPKKWFQTFLEPKTIASERNGTLAQELNVGFAEITITTFDVNGNPVPRTQCVRCYNGTVPGTTFRALPGDRIQFTVNNRLPKNQPAPAPGQNYDCVQLADNNFPGCFNTTNLHTHGLHVSPKTGANGVASDDVMLRIPPVGDTMDTSGEPSTRQYCLQLPTFHAPGTHWYHAHIHGATGIQVMNGVAGAIIIDEPPDQKIPADNEYIWMVQEVTGGSNAPGKCTTDPNDPNVYLSGSTVYSNMKASSTDSTKPYGSGQPQGVGFTVNSLSSPTLTMQPNEIQRWRIIDGTATPRGIYNFALLDATGKDVSNYMYLIAVDGITFFGHKPQQLPVSATPQTTPGGRAMAPGNRIDVLVSIPTPGTYKVWRLNNSHTGGNAANQILAVIDVAGPSMPQRNVADIPLPGWDKAPCYLQPIMDNEINADPLAYDFQINQGSGFFGGFKINGQVYGNPDGTHPNTTVKLGDVRRTQLTNSGGGNHPYHIHVNPFQLEHDLIDPKLPDDPWNWRWWDTILIPEGTLPPTSTSPGNPMFIRSRYVNYDGAFVIHCHILIHEDAGMMQDFTVQADPANGYPSVEPCTPLNVCQKGRPKTA